MAEGRALFPIAGAGEGQGHQSGERDLQRSQGRGWLLPAVAAWKQRCGLRGLSPCPLGAGACGAGSAESTDLTFPSYVLPLRPQFLPSTSQDVQLALWTRTAGEV